MQSLSARAQIIGRRTYCREKPDGTFETWSEMIDRVIGHQRWLWERALGAALNLAQESELAELSALLKSRKGALSGRTYWLGGTEMSRTREACQFNCAGEIVETVHDFVDMLWLLLNGCGVGFKPRQGSLNGFSRRIPEIEVIRSTRTLAMWQAGDRGREGNVETWDRATRTWTISIGDSAAAWAKGVGKLLAGKRPAEKLVIDLSEIRAAGVRLRGYGWISSGDDALSRALVAIAGVLNNHPGQLLTRAAVHDVANWCGTILSTRRSAQIALCDYTDPDWEGFATFKQDMWPHNYQREQSNNSLLFWKKPQRAELERVFELMLQAGGSEPGLINAEQAALRAQWFSTLNPCGEVLLPNKGFCNLVTNNLGAWIGDDTGMHRAHYLLARANYRQTCVDLRDGILQDAWHQNNDFLRLCGVSTTGQAMRPDLTAADYTLLAQVAIDAANSMADELGMPWPKNVTTGKPEGTLSKCMDATEGAHKPLAKYILNNVAFGSHDPLVPMLRDAGYKVIEHPSRPGDWLIALPAAWDSVEFDKVGGIEVNLESAVSQLDHYRILMRNYVQQNQSVTISYDQREVPAIIDWLMANWDDYVGVSFLFRADPLKTAEDLGYRYLPQQPVTKQVYDEYVAGLKPVSLDGDTGDELVDEDACANGVCPVR
jgi:ribonucleoside-triphosphate reductase